MFEYPKESGNWYQGKHEPLITKELFEMVQQQMKSNVLRTENKEFSFTKLITCGMCGSAISADEKFKKLKNGTVNRHVYYKCAKSKDHNCKNPPINETDLIKQFELVVDKMNLNSIKVKEKMKKEIERIKKFYKVINGSNEIIEINDSDIKNYAKFILKSGEINEKREILENISDKIKLENKKIIL